MIGGFRSKALERLWLKNDVRGVRQDHVDKVRLILAALNEAREAADMDQRSFRFHALKGDMAGRYAVSVNRNWRVTFSWIDDGPYAIEIDYEDYH